MERLKQLKLDHKAIASITFKINDNKDRSTADIGQ
jgi:hypothetical protein